jgi:hypothetical protein
MKRPIDRPRAQEEIAGTNAPDRYVARADRTPSAPPPHQRRVAGTPMTEQSDQDTRNALLNEFEKAISIVARERDVTPWVVIDACESLTMRCLTEILDQHASGRDHKS